MKSCRGVPLPNRESCADIAIQYLAGQALHSPPAQAQTGPWKCDLSNGTRDGVFGPDGSCSG